MRRCRRRKAWAEIQWLLASWIRGKNYRARSCIKPPALLFYLDAFAAALVSRCVPCSCRGPGDAITMMSHANRWPSGDRVTKSALLAHQHQCKPIVLHQYANRPVRRVTPTPHIPQSVLSAQARAMRAGENMVTVMSQGVMAPSARRERRICPPSKTSHILLHCLIPFVFGQTRGITSRSHPASQLKIARGNARAAMQPRNPERRRKMAVTRKRGWVGGPERELPRAEPKFSLNEW